MPYPNGIKPTSDRIGEVNIGWWYSFCCEEDLYPIETVEDIVDLILMYEEDEDGVYVDLHFWPSKELALKDLLA